VQAVELVDDWRELCGRRTKKGKAAARRLAAALQRVRTALRSNDLVPRLGLPWPLHEGVLERWILRCEAIASGKRRPNENTEIGASERMAASLAYALMRKYGRPVSTTKRGPFERLAAALWGHATANFHHHCRAVVSAKSGSK
jgi:hypothetical protein